VAKGVRSTGILLFASVIWGFAFVAQRAGMEHIGPFAFNGIRFTLGCLVLVPVMLWRGDKAPLPVKGGLLLGCVLFVGASLQQIGLVYTTAGNAGFVTGMYMVLVPIFGIVARRSTGLMSWLGAGVAFLGLFLLSVKNFRISPGDLFVFGGAVFWAIHVLIVDRIVQKTDPVRLSLLQFSVCALLSLGFAAAFEDVAGANYKGAFIPLMYASFLSVGVAYTLQLVGQKGAHPTHAAIVLSLEAVFALVGGWLILGEFMTPQGLFGCALMLAGMLMSQFTQIRNSK